MRLLNVHTLKLELFMSEEKGIPPYVILSHTWGDDEIVFDDIMNESLEALQQNPAFSKVSQTCLQAQRESFDYVWIDTCCIDKSSSAELSEAINSMFKYYAQASKCYVYLNDFNVPCLLGPGDDVSLGVKDTSFFHCRWFERGWTLQELIAPHKVEFFDQYWRRFGTRDGALRDRICRRTGIWPHVFDERRCQCQDDPERLVLVRDGLCLYCKTRDTLYHTLDTFAVSMKMSWAAARVTTRTEDAAYCLLGLFGINMPLLYGEGRKAFLRLQELIVRQSKDQSILLWQAFRTDAPLSHALGCLAPAADFFKNPVPIIGRRVFNNVDRQFEADFMGRLAPMELTDTTLITNLWLCPCTVHVYNHEIKEFHDRELYLGILDLANDDDFLKRPAILLEHMGVADVYRRVYNQLILSIDPRIQQSSFSIALDEQKHLDPRGPPRQVLVDYSGTTVTRDLSQAIKKDVKILLEQSPMNAIRTQLSTERSPSTGPIYLIMRPHYAAQFTADSGGTHPLLSSYESRASQLAAPWTFGKCLHWDADRYFGGIHFLELSFAAKESKNKHMAQMNPCKVEVVVVWGMHGENKAVVEELTQNPAACPWKTWCRVYPLALFIKAARTSADDIQPNQLYHRARALGPGEIQKRIEAQRRRLCLQSYSSTWVHSDRGPRKLLPDSCDEEWDCDILPGIVEDENVIIDLITEVNRLEGLGRTIYELEMSIQMSDKDGWSPELSQAQCDEERDKELAAMNKKYTEKENNIEREWGKSIQQDLANLRGKRERSEARIRERWIVRNRNRKGA